MTETMEKQDNIRAKVAVAAALRYATEVLPSDQYARLTLEEVDKDDSDRSWLSIELSSCIRSSFHGLSQM